MSTAAVPRVVGTLDDAALRRVVGSLCVGQVVGWGVLYYALPVLAGEVAATTGWGMQPVLAAFSVGLLVNAVAGIVIGRSIDRWGPRWPMAAGSALGVLAVLGVAAAPSYPAFVAAWVVAGLAMSASLYAPAFAAVTGWSGTDAGRRVRALTAVTLVGGLASTVFAPLTAVLADPLGWRGTYVALAVVLAVTALPAHVWGLRPAWSGGADQVVRDDVAAAPGRREVLAVAVVFTLAALVVYAGVTHLVPLLREHGASTRTAAIVLGLGGLGQVAGRLGWGAVVGRTGLRARTLLVLALVTATTALLAVVDAPVAALALVSVAAGVARGAVTLLQATAISDRWGTAGFGRRNGLLTAPVMAASAGAPWIGALLVAATGSYAHAFVVLALLAVLSTALVPLSVPRGLR